MTLRSTFIFGTALLLAGCSQAPNTDTTSSQPVANEAPNSAMSITDTQVKAVLIYADWCGSCKILDPKLKAIKSGAPIGGLEYVTLDYTDKDKAAFFAAASAAGVEAPVREFFGDSIKTGLLLLIDADDQTVIEKVTKAYSEDEIVTALKNAVAAS